VIALSLEHKPLSQQRLLHFYISMLASAIWANCAIAATVLPPDFEKVASSYGAQLAALSSDLEARQLFRSLASPLGLPRSDSAQSNALPSETQLIAGLARWRLADSIRDATSHQDPSQLLPIKVQMERQVWLLNQPGAEDLQRAARLIEVLSSSSLDLPQDRSLDVARSATSSPREPGGLSESKGVESDRPGPGPSQIEGFEDYAGTIDRTYPDLIQGEQSWVQIAEKDGAAGIQQRLKSPKQSLGQQNSEASARHYFDTRLRPVLTAQLVARAVRTRAAAEDQVRQMWLRLHESAELRRQRQGLARLCGTWQWTVHNHRNHQDQKLRISFPPPEVLESSSEGASSRPAKVVVLGEAVYLRWEFQGGFQEDSLLFTSQGQRLEGSFTNSAGAWGSITGKRTAPCETPGKRESKQ
jgi:hypothetical protein